MPNGQKRELESCTKDSKGLFVDSLRQTFTYLGFMLVCQRQSPPSKYQTGLQYPKHATMKIIYIVTVFFFHSFFCVVVGAEYHFWYITPWSDRSCCRAVFDPAERERAGAGRNQVNMN